MSKRLRGSRLLNPTSSSRLASWASRRGTSISPITSLVQRPSPGSWRIKDAAGSDKNLQKDVDLIDTEETCQAAISADAFGTEIYRLLSHCHDRW